MALSKRFDIVGTSEWQEILAILERELSEYHNTVVQVAGNDLVNVTKAWGIYEGYRRALGRLESFNDTESQES